MTYSCIKRQFMKIYKAGYSRYIIETDVKGKFNAVSNLMFYRISSPL